jgi:PAS domain S-box-containing protein
MDDHSKSKDQLIKELHACKVRISEVEVSELEHKRTHEKLAALEQMVNSLPLGVTISDISGTILYTNPAEAAMHGYTVEELLGREVRIFAPNGVWNPLTRDQARKIKRLEREAINLKKDGSTITVRLTSDVVRDRKGEPVAVITTSQEITAAKQAQAFMAALYKISNKAAAARDFQKLCGDAHNIVGGLIYARNFSVALYDPQSGQVSYPYYVDEFSAAPGPRPLKKSLLQEVIESGRPLYAAQETYERMMQKGALEEMETPFVNWLGVPLLSDGRCLGALAIKSYTEDIAFGQAEQELLTFMAQQLAGAVERLDSLS